MDGVTYNIRLLNFVLSIQFGHVFHQRIKTTFDRFNVSVYNIGSCLRQARKPIIRVSSRTNRNIELVSLRGVYNGYDDNIISRDHCNYKVQLVYVDMAISSSIKIVRKRLFLILQQFALSSSRILVSHDYASSGYYLTWSDIHNMLKNSNVRIPRIESTPTRARAFQSFTVNVKNNRYE